MAVDGGDKRIRQFRRIPCFARRQYLRRGAPVPLPVLGHFHALRNTVLTDRRPQVAMGLREVDVGKCTYVMRAFAAVFWPLAPVPEGPALISIICPSKLPKTCITVTAE
jgi:hypothetical protein